MKPISDILWQEICNDLLDHHSLFYKLGEMGKPFRTDRISTACVTFDKKGNFLCFLFNPDFWEKSTLYEKKFVICHEALHIILNHGKRFADSKDNTRANYAMDVVVNHSLVNRFGFIRDEISGWQDYCWVDTIFKNKKVNSMDIPEDETAEYYLNLLNRIYSDDKFSKQFGLVDEHSFTEEDMKELFEKLNAELSEEEKEALKKYLEKHGKEAGNTAGGLAHLVANEKVKVKRKWESVITKWTNLRLKDGDECVEQWARKHRRFQFLNNGMFLPSEMDIEEMSLQKDKITVYFYCDTSGSCWHLKDRFFLAAESLPKKHFDVKMFCFDTAVYPTDLKSRKMYGGGGTSFGIIENHLASETVNKSLPYPESVWVLTDGHGDLINPKFPERWHWFITEYGSNSYVPSKSKFYSLSDFS